MAKWEENEEENEEGQPREKKNKNKNEKNLRKHLYSAVRMSWKKYKKKAKE